MMLYLIHSKAILKDYLHSPQIKETADLNELATALFHSILSSTTPFNADLVIPYSEFKKLSSRDTNHTKEHIDELLEYRIVKIGGYKKKNIDIFILETSKKGFDEICLKLTSIANKAGVKLDCTTLSVEHVDDLEDSFDEYYSQKVSKIQKAKLLEDFFLIKDKYNKHKVTNMNRLTVNGLSRFDDWFKNGYVSYKHVSSFATNELKLPAGKADERNFYKLFGYVPSKTDCFSDDVLKFIKKKMKQYNLTTHKAGMMLEYYKGNRIAEDKYFDYKAPYEYLLLGSKRNVDRQFLIYISLLLGLSVDEIKTLFKKANCVLTDFLKEDILLLFFAENNYLIDIKQRGALFRYLWESK